MQTFKAPIFLNRFSSCPISSVTIDDDFTDLEYLDFYTLKSLECITLGKGITVICKDDLSNLRSLTTLNLQNSIKKIESNSIAYCQKLTAINFNGTMAQWNAIEKAVDWDKGSNNYTVYCSDGEIKK